MTYLPFVDGLRAIAILAVVAFHAVPKSMPGGFVGVDVFFVISGFLITRFIASELTEGTFSLARFFVRRARRLLPAAFFCFAVVAAIGAFVLLPDAYWYFGRSLVAAVLMFANIFFDETGGYFSAPSLEKPLLHTWSLAVEDQFYLTWPLLLMILWPRIPRSVLVAVGLAIAAASLAFAEVKLPAHPDFAFFHLSTRAWELMAGATIALIMQHYTTFPAALPVLPRLVAEVLAIVGAFAIVASFAMLSPTAHFPGLGAAPAVLGTAAIIIAGVHRQTLVTQLLAWRPMVFIGLISYSLYLWHWPLIALASYWHERPLDLAEASIVVALSFVIAILSWKYVERPFRAPHTAVSGSALSRADWQFVKIATSGVIAVLAIGMLLKIFKGFPERYDASVQTVLEQMVAGNPSRRACDDYQNIFRHDAVCNLGRKRADGQGYDVALFGDSMADHWAPLVAKFAAEKQLAFRQVTNGGCAFLTGIEVPAWPESKVPECAAYQDAALKFVEANPGLKLVVISGWWEKWLGRIEHPGVELEVPPATSDEEAKGNVAPRFDKVLNETLAIFTKRGIKVLLIGQIPTYQTLPVRCIVAAVRDQTDSKFCGMSNADAATQLTRSIGTLKRAASSQPGVSTWMPSENMCQSERCPPIADGTLLYKNGGHVNRFGAEYLHRFVEFPTLP